MKGVCEMNRSCHVYTCVYPCVHTGDASSVNTRLYIRPGDFFLLKNRQLIHPAIERSK